MCVIYPVFTYFVRNLFCLSCLLLLLTLCVNQDIFVQGHAAFVSLPVAHSVIIFMIALDKLCTVNVDLCV